MNGATILMIEDDPRVRNNNRELLELEGYRVLEADTLGKGRRLFEKEKPDLILLDILLPDGNGLEYCKELRGDSIVRILFVSALAAREDVVEGILAGGDGYIAKPYTNKELLAYVKMLLRRAAQEASTTHTEETALRFGDFLIDFSTRRAYLHGMDLLLKPKEFALLEILARNRDRTFTAEELYEKLWGMDGLGNTDTVNVHISRLRKKMGDTAPIGITSEWGKGYRLAEKIKPCQNLIF